MHTDGARERPRRPGRLHRGSPYLRRPAVSANAVPAAVVARLRKREKITADVVVIPGLGTALRIVDIKNVR